MKDDVQQSWEHFLNPESLRGNLLLASIYITAFEFLKGAIVDRIRTFFSSGVNESGPIVDEEYASEGLSLNRSSVHASLLWLKGMSVIGDADIEKFNVAKSYRNELAHELPKVLSSGVGNDYGERFKDLVDLLRKIETWWIVNVDMPLNPDVPGQVVDEDKIRPGSVMILQIMLDVALGSEEEASYYYRELKRKGF